MKKSLFELWLLETEIKKLQEEVVDLEDLREGVSITDLGLNDFRVDLSNFLKKYGKLKNIPEGIYAVAEAENEESKGVIFVLRNINNEVNIDKQNRLHPYYIIYIKENGDIIHNHFESKKSLDAIRLHCKGYYEPLQELCDKFSEETNDFKNMDFYSDLLKKSIGSIVKTEADKDIKSLFRSGGTTALTNNVKGLEDFSLISFVVIK